MAIETQGMTTLIQVYDMQRSLEFYCGILEFEILDKAGPPDDIGWVLMKLSGVYLMLNTQCEMPEKLPETDRKRFKAHGDTCLYFMCADPDAIYEQIIQKGVVAEKPKLAPYGMKQLYFLDPDGYGICFQSAVKIHTQIPGKHKTSLNQPGHRTQ